VKRLLFLVSLTLCAFALTTAAAASASAPVTLSFTKHAVSSDVYLGTIQGGGAIEVIVLDRRSTSSGQLLSALFRVNVGKKWFATVLRGSLDLATGRTTLEGKVTYGNWLQQAKVLEQGQLVGKDPYTFKGSLSLTAADLGGSDRDVGFRGDEHGRGTGYAIDGWLPSHGN
jgi:hypothetical protein